MTNTDTVETCNARITTAKGTVKFCKKPVGHDHTSNSASERKHSSAVRREYVPVDMDDLGSFKVVTSEAEVTKLAPKSAPGVKAEERSEFLKALDVQNQELYDAWVAAGSPKEFTRPVGKVHVDPAKVETMKFLIRKSVTFLGYGVTYGDDGVKDAKGRVVISWQVRNRRERRTSSE